MTRTCVVVCCCCCLSEGVRLVRVCLLVSSKPARGGLLPGVGKPHCTHFWGGEGFKDITVQHLVQLDQRLVRTWPIQPGHRLRAGYLQLRALHQLHPETIRILLQSENKTRRVGITISRTSEEHFRTGYLS